MVRVHPAGTEQPTGLWSAASPSRSCPWAWVASRAADRPIQHRWPGVAGASGRRGGESRCGGRWPSVPPPGARTGANVGGAARPRRHRAGRQPARQPAGVGFRRYTLAARPALATTCTDKRLLRVTGLPPQRAAALRRARHVRRHHVDRRATARSPTTPPSLFQRIGEEVGGAAPGRQMTRAVEVAATVDEQLAAARRASSPASPSTTSTAGAARPTCATTWPRQTGMVVGGARPPATTTPSPRCVPTRASTGRMRAYGDGEPLLPAGAFLDRYVLPWTKSGLTPVQQVYSRWRGTCVINGRYSDGGSRVERRYLPGHSEATAGRRVLRRDGDRR